MERKMLVMLFTMFRMILTMPLPELPPLRWVVGSVTGSVVVSHHVPVRFLYFVVGKLYGDFCVENYDIKGDTLECVSGGHYPGVFTVDVSSEPYTVTKFDVPADGSDFDKTAKKIFGEHYNDWMAVYNDDEARAELRTKTIADYVKDNGLKVTQYQDYGWEPVALK